MRNVVCNCYSSIKEVLMMRHRRLSNKEILTILNQHFVNLTPTFADNILRKLWLIKNHLLFNLSLSLYSQIFYYVSGNFYFLDLVTLLPQSLGDTKQMNGAQTEQLILASMWLVSIDYCYFGQCPHISCFID